MKKLMECVPNFSEGRDEAIVEQIIDEVRKIEGITILDYSSDKDHNRTVLTMIGSPEQVKEAEAINEEIVHYARNRGGTCTGEHGVGLGKAKYQRLEHGAAYEVMKTIKKTLDPNGILNPGKIFID